VVERLFLARLLEESILIIVNGLQLSITGEGQKKAVDILISFCEHLGLKKKRVRYL
jgi:hypothetical protein